MLTLLQGGSNPGLTVAAARPGTKSAIVIPGRSDGVSQAEKSMSMHFGRAEDHLELAMIELECAATDFSVLRASSAAPNERADLDTIILKLTVAKLTLQVAMADIAARSRVPVLACR